MLIDDIRNIKSGKKDLRNFAIVIGVALLLIGLLMLLKKNHAFIYLFITSGIILILGFILPVVLKPLQKIWMTFAVIMGWIVSRIILIILFFIILTPISLISRLFGKKYLDIRMDKTEDSYWHLREKRQLSKTDCEKQF
jgi:hypothetical protein